MNNTFSFNRFKNLLLNDGKMYFRNFGTTLIVFCCLNAIFWIVNLLFGTETNSVTRFAFLCVWTALAMMFVPEKVYGKANRSREGVSFAMMPTSSLEKFLSMFLYCAVLTPIVAFFGGYLVDTLLSLFPFGGFEKPIHLYSFNDLFHVMNNSEGVVQGGDNDFPFDTVFSIGMLRTSLCINVFQWAAIFMLGNMLFKKHKAGKTFGCYLGIGYVLSTILGGIIFACSGRIGQWFEGFSEYPTNEMIRICHNMAVSGMIFGIVITALLLFFTYRKIKTQKY